VESGPRLSVLSGALLAGLLLAAPPVSAKLYQRRDAALQRVFGTAARLEPRTAYLTPAQVEEVRRLARARFETPRLTYWEASHGDSLLGRAYLDTHPVRTLSATLLVAVGPDGAVRAVEVLAFHEPEDYLPPAGWLRTLVGRRLSEHLRPGDAVDGISGATLSARAFTEAVRRSLALDRILHGGRP
jgi:hypothetical protein